MVDPFKALLANTLDLCAPVSAGVVRPWSRTRGGTKQLYGVRPAARCPGRRLRLPSGAAPQNLLRAAPWLFKAAGSALLRRAAGTRRRHREPVAGGATATFSAPSQLGISSRCGPPASGACTCSLNTLSQRSGRPREGQSNGIGVGVTDAAGTVAVGAARIVPRRRVRPWCAPVRPPAPHAAPDVSSQLVRNFLASNATCLRHR